MTYNPRLYNIDNTVNVSGNLLVNNSGTYVSASTVNVTSVSLSSISASNITINKTDYNIINDYKTGIIKTDDNIQLDSNTSRYVQDVDSTVILADAKYKNIDIILPLASDNPGKQYVIKKIDGTNKSVNIKASIKSFVPSNNWEYTTINPVPISGVLSDNWPAAAGTNWLAIIQDNDASNGSISINEFDNLMVLGTPNTDFPEQNAGNIFIFRSSSVGWHKESMLSLNSSSLLQSVSGSALGTTVSINGQGNIIAAGAPYAKFKNYINPNRGLVVVYKSSSLGWQEETFLTSSGDGNPTGDLLGYNVSINKKGDIIAAAQPFGDRVRSPASASIGCISIFRSSSNVGWYEEAFLSSSGDRIVQNETIGLQGIKLNYDGNIFIVSYDLFDSGAVSNIGAILVFRSSSIGWTQEALLSSSLDGSPASDRLGFSIDINRIGDVIVAGSLADQPAAAAGAVTIFRSSSLGWRQEQHLTSSGDGSTSGDLLGYSVSIDADGKTLVAGYPLTDVGGTSRGGMVIYASSSTGWTQTKFISGNVATVEGQNELGKSVAINQSGTIVYGVANPNITSLSTFISSSQAALITVLSNSSGNNWSSKTVISGITDMTPEFTTKAGWSIAYSEYSQKLVIGIPNYQFNDYDSDPALNVGSVGTTRRGAINIFKRDNNTWIEEKLLYVSSSEHGVYSHLGRLGNSVDINYNGDVVAAGSPGTFASPAYSGSVCVFRSSSNGWTHETVLTHSGDTTYAKNNNDYLGFSVALNDSGNVVVAGAPNIDIPATVSGTGAVVVFTSSSIGWRQQAQLTSSYSVVQDPGSPFYGPNFDYLGYSVSINGNGDKFAAGMPGRDQTYTGSGGVVIFRNVGGTGVWRQEAVLLSRFVHNTPWRTGSSNQNNPEAYFGHINYGIGTTVAMSKQGNLVAASDSNIFDPDPFNYTNRGDWVYPSAINTPGYDAPQTVRIFRSGTTSWREEAILFPEETLYDLNIDPNNAGSGRDTLRIRTGFGSSLKFNSAGDTLYIGAPNIGCFSPISSSVGGVYIFCSGSDGWYQHEKIIINSNEDLFTGISIAYDNNTNTIIAGATHLDSYSDGYKLLNYGGVVVFDKPSIPSDMIENIDGNLLKSLSTPYESINLISDGTSSWKIL